ncbi:flagellar biosynthesis anti-sigma factor FlgM [Desulfurispirillum indicum]|uniref:Negative regulator of flagellin synthesis n=1 Tax=Desulfurispirillum indicum (strain ATCC BAA-1389 / DSM 22839 / S5) TaxID=653733 RepID=E6W2E3_DESIS|nr:flagellar biosynthesis anti-sigma factor FlgM [Desulfurispirillum indicum]ADU66693.1 Anti-sigma-28 factor FlgM family protein [Desulfurispirillum indicum S5]UCZ56010.1 flagellar biosynthesis anti-sigma factor FlgM [Desulfurispirillum indicum]
MKVNGYGSSSIDAYLKNNRTQGKSRGDEAVQGKEGAGGNADKIHFSGTYMDVAKATKVASDAPEVRDERVETLKAAIQRGDYRYNLDMLAAKLAEVLGKK